MQVRALVLLFAAPCAAQSLYPQRASAPFGVAGFTLADCDQDGRLDLLTAPGNAAPLVLRGDGAQGFESWLALAFDNPGKTLTVADFDGDGAVDVVAARTSTQAAVFRGLGASGFQARANAGLGAIPDALASGDLDGDGKRDLAWLQSSNSLGVARGDGAFAFAVSSAVAAVESGALACVDLDGDGRPEVVHAARPTFHSGELVSRAVDAQGALGPQLVLHATGLLYVWGAGDLDADGDLDVVLQEEPSLALAVLANTNGALQQASAPFTARRARDFAIADVNQDGRADLLAAADGATSADPALEIWIGLGGLVLGPQLVVRELGKPSSVAVADLEGDGSPDVIVGHSGAGARATVLRTQGGALVAPTRVPLADEPLALASVDWNRDGAADVLTTTASEFVLALGNGQGGIGASTLPLPPGSSGGLAIGDWDQDGAPDVACGTSNGVWIANGDGQGGIASSGVIALGFAPSWLGSADFDQDGYADLALARTSMPALAILPGTTGGFSAPLPLAAPTTLAAVAIGFAGSDAFPDLVASPATSAALELWKGAPAFAFAPQSIAKPGFQREVVLADLDGDGRDDLALGGGSATAWKLQSAAGAFSGTWGTSSDVLTSQLAVGDVDGDGRADLVGHNDALGLLRPLLGASGPTFAVVHEHVSSGATRGVVLVDLDGDGRLEVASGASAAHELWLHANLRADASGASAFGSGTPGCPGAGGAGASGVLSPGGSVRVLASGAPPRGLGWGIVAVAPIVAGADPFGLGVKLHVDLLAGPAFVFALRADAAGVASRLFPIPADPHLVGAAIPVQSLWPWAASAPCDPSPLGLSSSRGLQVLIGP